MQDSIPSAIATTAAGAAPSTDRGATSLRSPISPRAPSAPVAAASTGPAASRTPSAIQSTNRVTGRRQELQRAELPPQPVASVAQHGRLSADGDVERAGIELCVEVPHRLVRGPGIVVVEVQLEDGGALVARRPDRAGPRRAPASRLGVRGDHVERDAVDAGVDGRLAPGHDQDAGFGLAPQSRRRARLRPARSPSPRPRAPQAARGRRPARRAHAARSSTASVAASIARGRFSAASASAPSMPNLTSLRPAR